MLDSRTPSKELRRHEASRRKAPSVTPHLTQLAPTPRDMPPRSRRRACAIASLDLCGADTVCASTADVRVAAPSSAQTAKTSLFDPGPIGRGSCRTSLPGEERGCGIEGVRGSSEPGTPNRDDLAAAVRRCENPERGMANLISIAALATSILTTFFVLVLAVLPHRAMLSLPGRGTECEVGK